MNILILGYGYIATKLHAYFPSSVMCTKKLYSINDIHNEIINNKADVVINCIGKTGIPNIDWCELNKEETFFTNVTLAFMIREVCSALKVRMVHISSGCIYTGDGYYTEKDLPNFTGSFYSRTKTICEYGLKEFDVLQLRIRMPLDSEEHPRNLLTKLLNYDETINILNSVTVINDFLEATRFLLDNKQTGIFNIVSPKPILHTQLLELYNEYAQDKKIVKEISLDDLHDRTLAERSNCTLSTKKLLDAGFEISEFSIINCVREYAQKIGAKECLTHSETS